ncbi:MAG TPA: hypothetical protein VJS39_05705 [Gemmatimonadaceae bacterium]|nr:hypothetical protein [Gemmatimonadaceae bacterium]
MKHPTTLLVGFALVTACSSESITKDTNDLRSATSQSFGASVNQDLARLRQATAAFQVFDSAFHAGWSAQITPCMTDPGGAGGMGFHYGNVGLINGTATVENPQLLLYEPEKNGRLRLVAVEYIIPYTFVPRSATPPRLFNQDFQQVDAFQLWGLHAWVWRENPSGIFAPWNPRVNCVNATASVSMSH